MRIVVFIYNPYLLVDEGIFSEDLQKVVLILEVFHSWGVKPCGVGNQILKVFLLVGVKPCGV